MRGAPKRAKAPGYGGSRRLAPGERRRQQEIRDRCAIVERPEWSSELIARGLSSDETRDEILNRLADESGPEIHTHALPPPPKPRPPRGNLVPEIADLDEYVVKAVYCGLARDRDDATRKLVAGDAAARALYIQVAQEGDAAVARRHAAWPSADYGGRTLDDAELRRLASPIPYYIVLQDTAVPALATKMAKATREYRAEIQKVLATTNAKGTELSYANLRDRVTASPWPGAHPSSRLGRFERWLIEFLEALEQIEPDLAAFAGERGADLGVGRHKVRDPLTWSAPRTAAWLREHHIDHELRLLDLVMALEHHGQNLGLLSPTQKTRMLSRLLDRARRTAHAAGESVVSKRPRPATA